MTSINGPAEPRTDADRVVSDLRGEVERLRRELEQARETNARLNRRCQAAEAAVRDARLCIDRLSEKPWCSGSLGRAFLAYENTLLIEKLQRAEAERDEARELARGLLNQGASRQEGDRWVIDHMFISAYEEAVDYFSALGLLEDIGRELYAWRQP